MGQLDFQPMSNLFRSAKCYTLRRCASATGAPYRVWVEPTNMCNLSCRMCPTGWMQGVERGFMDFDAFKRIVDDISGKTTEIVLHHRGESLLHPKLGEMIRYARSHRLKTILHTNGTLLDEAKTDMLLSAGLDFISFSVDGWDAESYESIREGADFHSTLARVRYFLDRRVSDGLPGPRVQVEVMHFPIRESPGKRKIRQVWRGYFPGDGLDKVVVKNPHNWGGLWSPTLSEEVAQPRKSIEDPITGRPFIFDFRFSQFGRRLGRFRRHVPCTFPWFGLTVFWNGDVVPCPQDFCGKLRLSCAAEKTLTEIWHGEPLRRLRETLVSGRCTCADCDMLQRRSVGGIPLAAAVEFLRRIPWLSGKTAAGPD